jgi:hypothetical protein
MDHLPRKSATFRPRMRPLALEPRILFDGAAGVAVEQQAAEVLASEAAALAAEASPRTLGASGRCWHVSSAYRKVDPLADNSKFKRALAVSRFSPCAA